MTESEDQTFEDDQANETKPEDVLYFVADSIKDRLGGEDGPSFSVASLFSSKSENFSEHEEPAVDSELPDFLESATGTIWKKDSLFILDPHDSRTGGVRQFFDVQPLDTNSKDMINLRREINLIVKSKLKRIERNHDKLKTAPSRFTNPKHKFKKQKT